MIVAPLPSRLAFSHCSSFVGLGDSVIDLGVMCQCEKILQTAIDEKADVTGTEQQFLGALFDRSPLRGDIKHLFAVCRIR